VTTWAVAAFIAAIWELMFCLFESIVVSFNLVEAWEHQQLIFHNIEQLNRKLLTASLPNSGITAFDINSFSIVVIISWLFDIVMHNAFCGALNTLICLFCGPYERHTHIVLKFVKRQPNIK